METYTFLAILFVVTSAITTFDKRMIQDKKAGILPPNRPLLPFWVGLISWAHWGLAVALLIMNWKYSLAIFAILFILSILPVLEIVGAILMSPFVPKNTDDFNRKY